jgi:hypothetical protein
LSNIGIINTVLPFTSVQDVTDISVNISLSIYNNIFTDISVTSCTDVKGKTVFIIPIFDK